MTKLDRDEICDLLDRASRITAAEAWTDIINPTQRAALSYLARANRFSRAPSLVADYLGTTRGTASQTLKALARKGLIEERRSTLDKRSISYDVTPGGLAALEPGTAIDAALAQLAGREAAGLAAALKTLLKAVLRERGGRSFGICKTCRHHRKGSKGAHCTLLHEDLLPAETRQICHEHDSAA